MRGLLLDIDLGDKQKLFQVSIVHISLKKMQKNVRIRAPETLFSGRHGNSVSYFGVRKTTLTT